MALDTQSPRVLVTVKSEAEAQLIAGVLDEHGIQATVSGGFLCDFRAEAPGYADVVVKNADFAAAQKVLQDFRQGANREPSPLEEQDRIVCPRCGSANVNCRTDLGFLSEVLQFLLLGFPFFKAWRGWKCADCGNKFQSDPKRSPG